MTRYAVFGNPVEHSQSPAIHHAFAAQTGEDVQYDKQQIEAGCFDSEVRAFFANGGGGLNITVPFKLEAYALADRLTDRAKKAGAVNTLYTKDQLLCGDNTDGVGLCRDLTQNLQWPVTGAKILVLGAGGAVRGVLGPLLAHKPKAVTLANRTQSKAKALAEAFVEDAKRAGCKISGCGFAAVTAEFDIIINGTSASLSGDLPAISPAVFNQALCYDMMYGAAPTPFLQWAAKQGARSIVDGLGMLVEQAAESFFIWREIHPETRPVIERVRQSLITNL